MVSFVNEFFKPKAKVKLSAKQGVNWNVQNQQVLRDKSRLVVARGWEKRNGSDCWSIRRFFLGWCKCSEIRSWWWLLASKYIKNQWIVHQKKEFYRMQIISIILTYGEEHKTGISALTAGTPGSIPVWGTKIPQAMLWGQKKSSQYTRRQKTQTLEKKSE